MQSIIDRFSGQLFCSFYTYFISNIFKKCIPQCVEHQKKESISCVVESSSTYFKASHKRSFRTYPLYNIGYVLASISFLAC